MKALTDSDQVKLSPTPPGLKAPNASDNQVCRRLFRALRRRLRLTVMRLDPVCVRLASTSGWLSSLYYLICSAAFRREQRSVLMGRLRYEDDIRAPAGTSALLRRNIHRLEKGILMRPKRSVYALDYIEDTLQCYQLLLDNGSDSDEIRWARDVLDKYFTDVEANPIIERARALFDSLPKPNSFSGHRIPYLRNLSDPLSVQYEDLLNLAKRRRSVRWFLDKSVSRRRIDQAIEVAKLSPSACNRQPFQFRVFDDHESAQRIGAIAMGTAGYNHNIPVLIAVVGRLGNYFSERDRHLIYVDGSLASMSLVYAFETLELSTCCINWADMEERERQISDELRLTPDERVIMLIAVGYPDPDAMVAYSQKKPLDEIRRYNLE